MRTITYREAITEAIAEEMVRDHKVILMGQDVGQFGGATQAALGLLQQFGSGRILETPISESAVMGTAVGVALMGYRPILEIGLADNVLLAMDHIVNSAAKIHYLYDGGRSASLVVRLWSGYRPNGGPQQSQSNEAIFNNVPGLKIIMPSTPSDIKGMLKSAIRDDDPVVCYEPKSVFETQGYVPEGEHITKLGLADVKVPGHDVTVIALGSMVAEALQVAENINKEGISVEVIDPRTIRPLDKKTVLESVQKTGRVVIAHEASVIGGVGAEIASIIADEAFSHLKAPVKRLGCAEVPVPSGRALKSAIFPSQDVFAKTIREVCAYKY